MICHIVFFKITQRTFLMILNRLGQYIQLCSIGKDNYPFTAEDRSIRVPQILTSSRIT